MIAPRLTPLDAYAMSLHSESGTKLSEQQAINLGFQFLHYARTLRAGDLQDAEHKLIDLREEALNKEDTPGTIALHKAIQSIRAQLHALDNEYSVQFKNLPSRVRETLDLIAKEHEMNGKAAPPR